MAGLLLRCVFYLAAPVVFPAFWIERLLTRMSGRIWSFDLRTSSIYFSAWCALATAAIIFPTLWVKCVALYVLFSLQVIAWLAVSLLPAGYESRYHLTIRSLVRHPLPFPSRHIFRGVDQRGLWIAITAYLYTSFFLGALAFVVNSFDSTAYSGARAIGASADGLFQFFYMSFVMMATMNFTNVLPDSTLTRVLAMFEFSLGLLFTLLIFSLFVDKIIKIRSGGGNEQREASNVEHAGGNPTVLRGADVPDVTAPTLSEKEA